VTAKELREIRIHMGLTQVELAERLRIARNSVVRMENGQMIVTPPMELLIGFVAREAGVETTAPDNKRSRRAAKNKTAHGGKAADSGRDGERRKALPPRRHRRLR
jgi:DNA-binding XRE family transcriptional regulator